MYRIRDKRGLAWLPALVVVTAVAAVSMAVPGSLLDFQIVNSSGQSVSSNKVAPSDKWLLVYVQPQCAPCRTVVKMLNESELPGVANKVVLIVGGASSDATQSMALAFPNLPSTQWFADPQRTTYTQLSLQGAPVIIGLQQNTIRWALAGVNPDTPQFKSTLSSWVQGN